MLIGIVPGNVALSIGTRIAELTRIILDSWLNVTIGSEHTVATEVVPSGLEQPGI